MLVTVMISRIFLAIFCALRSTDCIKIGRSDCSDGSIPVPVNGYVEPKSYRVYEDGTATAALGCNWAYTFKGAIRDKYMWRSIPYVEPNFREKYPLLIIKCRGGLWNSTSPQCEYRLFNRNCRISSGNVNGRILPIEVGQRLTVTLQHQQMRSLDGTATIGPKHPSKAKRIHWNAHSELSHFKKKELSTIYDIGIVQNYDDWDGLWFFGRGGTKADVCGDYIYVDIFRDGAWGAWMAWSNPDCKACIGADSSRQRLCNNPTPLGKTGKKCPGDSKEIKGCEELQLCPDKPSWTTWTTCQCNDRRGRRKRKLHCPSSQVHPDKYSCQLPSVAEEIEKCELEYKCVIVPSWSDWSECKCENNMPMKKRVEKCDITQEGVICLTPLSSLRNEEIECNSTICHMKSSWSPWSDCFCQTRQDEASAQRRKECSDLKYPKLQKCDVPEPLTEDRACDLDCTKFDGWKPWSFWSPCTKSCGVGTRMRDRKCLIKELCLNERDERNFQQIEDCSIFPCPGLPGHDIYHVIKDRLEFLEFWNSGVRPTLTTICWGFIIFMFITLLG